MYLKNDYESISVSPVISVTGRGSHDIITVKWARLNTRLKEKRKKKKTARMSITIFEL